MSQSITVQETHQALCTVLNLNPTEVHFAHCSLRPGHGRIEALENTTIFTESIFRYVNESSYLLILNGQSTVGSLRLHESSLWFDAYTNTHLEDQAIIDLDSDKP